MVNITKFTRKKGNRTFTNTKELSNYPGFLFEIEEFEADRQNTTSMYKDKELGYQLEDVVRGQIQLFDASGRNVGKIENASWAASKSTLRDLEGLVGHAVLIRVVKPGRYWNLEPLDEVDPGLYEKIVATLQEQEDQIKADMEDAPSFD